MCDKNDDCRCGECGNSMIPECDYCKKKIEICSQEENPVERISESFHRALVKGWTLFSILGTHRMLICPECAYDKCTRCGKQTLEVKHSKRILENGITVESRVSNFFDGVVMLNAHIPDNAPSAPCNTFILCARCFNEVTPFMKAFFAGKKLPILPE